MLLSAWSPDVSNDIMKIRHHIVAPATAWCRTNKWWKISIFRGRLFWNDFGQKRIFLTQPNRYFHVKLVRNGYFSRKYASKTDIFRKYPSPYSRGPWKPWKIYVPPRFRAGFSCEKYHVGFLENILLCLKNICFTNILNENAENNSI